jgi:acetyltransferase-like isoleucine patch superfamily enzyme
MIDLKKNSLNATYLDATSLKKLNFKKCGKNVLISKLCTIINAKNIEIKNNVRIDNYSILIAGDKKNTLKIGSNVHIASFCFINGRFGVTMKDYSGLGIGVNILTVNDDFSGRSVTNPTTSGKKLLYTGSVIIGKAVNVGINTTIMPRTKVGNYSSIGSYSFVKGILKSGYVFVGNPAVPIYKKNKTVKNLLTRK